VQWIVPGSNDEYYSIRLWTDHSLVHYSQDVLFGVLDLCPLMDLSEASQDVVFVHVNLSTDRFPSRLSEVLVECFGENGLILFIHPQEAFQLLNPPLNGPGSTRTKGLSNFLQHVSVRRHLVGK
jgi:hypothetical protein